MRINSGHGASKLTFVLFDNVECWDGTWQLWSWSCFVSRNVEIKDDRRSSSGLSATVRLRRRFSRNLAWVRRAIIERRTNANRLSANPWRSWCCSRLFLNDLIINSLATRVSILYRFVSLPFKFADIRRTTDQGYNNHLSIQVNFRSVPSNNMSLYLGWYFF